MSRTARCSKRWWSRIPDTFNETLNMVQRWRKVNNPLLETVCAENNLDFFNQNLF